MLGDVDIARLGDRRLEIATTRGDAADLGGLVDDLRRLPLIGSRLERTGTNVDHRAGGNVAANMSADLSAKLLAHSREIAPVHAMSSTSETNAAFSLMDSPGARSIPK